MRRRAPVLLALAAIADVGARLLVTAPGMSAGPARVSAAWILAMGTFPLFGIGAGGLVIRRIDAPDTVRRWLFRALLLAAGTLLMLPAKIVVAGFEIRAGAIHVAWSYEPLVLGLNLVLYALFPSFGELVVWLMRRTPSISTKFLAAGMFSALATLAIRRAAGSIIGDRAEGWVSGIVMVATVTSIVYGFAATFAAGMSRWFSSSRKALEAFGRGENDVRLDESPADETGMMARTFNAAVAQRREAQFLERAFGRYVAPSVLEALRRNRSELHLDRELTLASRRVEATVLYADIRGFTRFSENETPEEVMRVLNVYFEKMIDVIGAHEGYINKFIGDAVMVVFNAPLEQVDHAARAVRCACAMQAALAEMNARRAFGSERVVEVGIGVNSGPVVAGSLGNAARAEYTVIGDTVNVAARLTAAAKPREILVGAQTAASSGEKDLEPMPPLTVKGKSMPLEVFRVAGEREAARA